MRPISNRDRVRLCAALTALALLPSCGSSKPSEPSSSPASPSSTTGTPVAAPPPTPSTKNWFDLQVGDCVTEIPAIDTGVVTTTVVDCDTPHQAEIYLLAPLAVDTAVYQVAHEKCAEGFVSYTGQSFVGGPYAVTYLIDSNQDRTADNPTPSTAICLIQHANGAPLAGSLRR
jgi:hypothetical protein